MTDSSQVNRYTMDEKASSETSGGGGPAHGNIEVDFYDNPTILSRLILNEKYDSAVARAKRFPEEASIWVISKRNPYRGTHRTDGVEQPRRKPSVSSKNYTVPRARSSVLELSVRQLPLHMVCSNLFRTKPESALRPALERLIITLIVTYPSGTQEVDHEGKLPLHELIWNDSSPQVISMVLLANPPSVHERDRYDRTPMDLNRFRKGTNKEQVKQMLLRGTHFWEQARRVAFAKMKKNKDGAATKADDGTPQEESKEKRVDTNEKIEPVTWIKLERRAIHLERLLAGMYEKNYEQGELIDELNRSKSEMLKELDALCGNYNSSDTVVDLAKENETLRQKLQQVENAMAVLSDQSIGTEETPVGSQQDYAMLQEQVKALTETERSLQAKTERLELLVDSFRQSDDKEQNSDEFKRLVLTIRGGSHYATERYLASKVVDMEEMMLDMARSQEAEIEAIKAENARLVKENQALATQRASIHISSVTARSQSLDKLSAAKNTNEQSCSSLPEEKSSKAVASDNLDDLLDEAASEYESSSRSGLEGMFQGDTPIFSDSFVRAGASDNLDYMLGEAASMYQSSVQSDISQPPDARSISSQESVMALPDLLSSAKRMYYQQLPDKLDDALKQASLMAEASNVNKMVVIAERIYGEEVPPEFVHCMHTAAVRGADSSSLVGKTAPSRSSISKRNFSLQSAADREDDLDTVLEEAEALNGMKLRQSLIKAWLNTSIDDPSIATVSRVAGDDDESVLVSTDDLEAILSEAARVYSQPILPSEKKAAANKKTNETKVTIQRLTCITKSSPQSPVRHMSPDTLSAFSTQSDNLDDMPNEAASRSQSDNLDDTLNQAASQSPRNELNDAAASHSPGDNLHDMLNEVAASRSPCDNLDHILNEAAASQSQSDNLDHMLNEAAASRSQSDNLEDMCNEAAASQSFVSQA